jgi:hypothetical protein
MSEIYRDLKARASEHGVVPAFKFTQGDPPGQVVTAFIRLTPEPGAAGFARLAIHDNPHPPSTQYLVEVERLRSLIDSPV